MSERIIVSAEIAGRKLELETGKLAQQAHGAVVARAGDTVVLSTVVAAAAREDLDYFPLSVEYEERLYAGGIIKGSQWVKREGRPTDEAILNGRLIDRAIRPLFPKEYKQDLQVIVTVLSVDLENDPAVLGLIATSAALQIAGVPWDGPVAGVRVGLIDGEFVLNPLRSQLATSEMDLVVACTKDDMLMVEMGGSPVEEQKMIEALEFGYKSAASVLSLITEFKEAVAAKLPPRYEYTAKELTEDEQVKAKALEEAVEYMHENFPARYLDTTIDKTDRNKSADDFIAATAEKYVEAVDVKKIAAAFEDVAKVKVREKIIKTGERVDGRKVDEVRPITVEIGVLPRTHGSAIFQRGETQVLNITTLGSTSLEQTIESAEGTVTKRYIHHYNFPPFSVGETGRVGSPKRREIGHGALAERALEPVIPTSDEFPYTIRLVSEVLGSNGSTSMASVCGSTLSLMDAGVKIKAPVSGVAMGLIKERDDIVVLTDIQGVEDFYGDMDFKVAGTADGITALQMDVKITGITMQILAEAIKAAKAGRIHILNKMLEVIDTPRSDLSQYAPRIATIKINPKKIGELIGPGGKIIRALQEETKTEINVEEDGTVHIAGLDPVLLQQALEQVEMLTKEVEIGQIYKGKVVRIMDFGAFVELIPGKDGLIHISELAPGYVESVRDEVKEGDEVEVKVIEIDDQGRVNLSRKALMGEQRAEEQHGGNNNDGQNRGGGHRGGQRGGGRPNNRR